MELPDRKHPRLKEYDYSQAGYYYVTIHVADKTICLSRVGRGLAPADAAITLSAMGKVAEQQLLLLEKRYPFLRIDTYVIMPTHVHAILVFENEVAGASSHPTLMDVVCAYKSLTTRECNRIFQTPGRKIFQTSFYESVLRNESAYRECWQYIDENPRKWLLNPEDL